jgi:hypothetical protein
MGGGGGGAFQDKINSFFFLHTALYGNFYVQLRRICSLVTFSYLELLLASRSNEQMNHLDCPAAGSCRARR